MYTNYQYLIKLRIYKGIILSSNKSLIMKKLFTTVTLVSIVFLFSCNSNKKINNVDLYQSDTLKSVSNLFIYKSDTFKIDSDTIFINTNKEIKKADTNNIIKRDISTIEFVGNTEIQKAISNNSDIPANAGIGVRFTKKYGSPTSILSIDKLEIDISISIASTVDTIKTIYNSSNEIENINSFGNSVLLPVNSGQSVSLNVRTFMNKRNTYNTVLGQNWGIQGRLNASNRIWSDTIVSQEVSTLSLTIGVFTELVPIQNMDKFSISVGVDLSSRWIFGNIGHEYAENFRKDIIGTDKTFYYGIEPNITIRLKDIKAVASFPILFSDDDVPGLTQGQFVTMIGFTGGFPLNISKN